MNTNEEILKTADKLRENAGIRELNDMQMCMIKEYDTEQAVLLVAPTGSGKTLAFILPLASRIICGGRQGTQAIILSPSRELSQQIEQVFRSTKSGLNVVLVCGGHSVEQEEQKLRHRPQVIVGTPGRLLDHIRRGNVQFQNQTTVSLIIDEFDKCLELGFESDMRDILDFWKDRDHTIFASATKAIDLSTWTDTDHLHIIEYTPAIDAIGKLELRRVTTPNADKLPELISLCCSFGGESAIVFCNFRESVARAAKALQSAGIDAIIYHGALEQKDRERALFMFASGCASVLVTTDLAARGLDISSVRHVVHLEMPQTIEAFTHRNGRTARQGADGTAYVMVCRDRTLPDFLPKKIEEQKLTDCAPISADFLPIYISRGKKEKVSKGDVAGFLMKVASLDKNDIGLISLYDHYSLVSIRKTAIRKVMKADGEKIKGEKCKVEIAR